MPIHDFSSHNQVRNEAISFYTKRMIFRPLARNDLSFRETVVGFITGLNFPRQGQRSDLSDGRVNEQGRWSETVQEIESEKGREREREKERSRKTVAKRHPRRNSNIGVSSDSPSSFLCYPSNPCYLYTHT